MNLVAHQVAERLVDHPLPVQSRLTFECRTDNLDGKVRFAAAVVTGMAVMTGAIIDHVQGRWREFGDEPLFNLAVDWTFGHRISILLFPDIY